MPEAEPNFRLRPVPSSGTSCPRCGASLLVERLHLPGWRMLAEGSCGDCGHRYLVDLPSGHGLVYPAALDLDTGETLDPAGATWFSQWLAPAWRDPDRDAVSLRVDLRHESGGEAVLVNCLDGVYGHSVLKLLATQAELDRGREVILLAPAALKQLVPDGVAEAWIVEEPIPRFARWLAELDGRLGEELDRIGVCLLSPAPPHPHPSTYEIDRFVGDLPGDPLGQPSLVLSLRDDRRWGRSAKAQSKNVTRLVAALARTYPGLGVTAVGAGTTGALGRSVRDLRSLEPGPEEERRWLVAMRGADLAVGVHGSNLLLPSALAKSTIELVPETRYGNLFQATLIGESDPLLALNHHRTMYGDADLSDVAPERVASVATALLDDRERFETMMSGPVSRGHGRLGRPLPSTPERGLNSS